jgi:hypothetical protein
MQQAIKDAHSLRLEFAMPVEQRPAQLSEVYRRTKIGQRVDGNQAAGLTANA